MRKPEYHKQLTNERCGICCLLMAQQAFRPKDYATNAKQTAYYRDYGAKSTPGTLGSTIAYVLYMKGLDVKIVHGSERLLENHGQYFAEEKYEAILAEHEKWLRDAELFKAVKKRPDDSFQLVRGHRFDCAELRSELEKGRLIIVQMFVDGDEGGHKKLMHWILLYGFEEGQFRAIDPMPKPVGGKIKLSCDELESHLDTPFERCYISIWEEQD